MPGRLALRLGLGMSPITAAHTAHERLSDGTEIEVWHRQSSFVLDARIDAELGLTSGVALAVEVPLRLFATDIRYEDFEGRAVPIANGDVHHRDETLVGPGDPRLGVRLGLRNGDWSFGATLGLRLPLGRTEPNPYTEAAETTRHQHVQFGTGTFDPELGVSVDHDFGAVTVGAWGWLRAAFYANTFGFQAGNRYAGGVTIETGFGLATWRFRASFDVNSERAERWDGEPPVDDGNQGRVDVYAGLGATWQATPDFFVGAGARVPLYTHIVGGQLELPIVVSFDVGGSFEVWDAAVDEGEVVPDAGAGDVLDVRSPLPAFGKLTVIDYQAAWCAPCDVLATLLAGLAREHPELAVRRFDVSDDPPADMGLPHVDVYDATGSLIYRGEGDPAALAADIEAFLQGQRPPSRMP